MRSLLTKHLLFFDIKCEICPDIFFSLPLTFHVLPRFHMKRRTWEGPTTSCYSVVDQIVPANLAAQGDFFWLDNLQTRPASLNKLINCDCISFLQNIFIWFLFVDDSVGIFHHSFLSSCICFYVVLSCFYQEKTVKEKYQ